MVKKRGVIASLYDLRRDAIIAWSFATGLRVECSDRGAASSHWCSIGALAPGLPESSECLLGRFPLVVEQCCSIACNCWFEFGNSS